MIAAFATCPLCAVGAWGPTVVPIAAQAQRAPLCIPNALSPQVCSISARSRRLRLPNGCAAGGVHCIANGVRRCTSLRSACPAQSPRLHGRCRLRDSRGGPARHRHPHHGVVTGARVAHASRYLLRASRRRHFASSSACRGISVDGRSAPSCPRDAEGGHCGGASHAVVPVQYLTRASCDTGHRPELTEVLRFGGKDAERHRSAAPGDVSASGRLGTADAPVRAHVSSRVSCSGSLFTSLGIRPQNAADTDALNGRPGFCAPPQNCDKPLQFGTDLMRWGRPSRSRQTPPIWQPGLPKSERPSANSAVASGAELRRAASSAPCAPRPVGPPVRGSGRLSQTRPPDRSVGPQEIFGALTQANVVADAEHPSRLGSQTDADRKDGTVPQSGPTPVRDRAMVRMDHIGVHGPVRGTPGPATVCPGRSGRSPG